MKSTKEIIEILDDGEVSYESSNDIFSKSNSLISSKYKASLLEQKLLNIVLARLQQKNYVDKGVNEGLVCEIKTTELKNLLGLKSQGGSFYEQLKPAAAAMTSRTLGFVNNEMESFKYISLITSAEYADGIFTVKFNSELKKYLNPKTQFTVLELPILLQYKSIYSLRLHEMLLSRCFKRKNVGVAKYTGKESTGKHYKFDIGLSELKLSLGVVNADSPPVRKILSGASTPDYDKAVEKATEKSFNAWGDFRKRVIEVAVAEINKMDNGINVEYEPLKGGKGAKVYGITFYVNLCDSEEKDEVEEKSEEKAVLTEDEQFEVMFQVKTLIKETVSLKDIKTICETANYNFNKIETAYKVANDVQNITNLVGFMIKAIKDEYSESVKAEHKRKRENRFNNFHQREYDFDEYEKKLLNRNM